MRSPNTSRSLRALILLLAIAVFGFQAFYTADVLRANRGATHLPRVPIRLSPVDGRIGMPLPEARDAGVERGDVPLTFGGAAIRGRADLARLIDERQYKPGDTVHFEFRRGNEPQTRTAAIVLRPMRTARIRPMEWAVITTLDILKDWTCLLLGFYVVFVRPRDPLAWILLGLMYSFAQLSLGQGMGIERWDPTARNIATFARAFAQRTWGFWMLLFGVYFPDPQSRTRVLAWARWVPGLLLPVFGVLGGLQEAGMQADIARTLPLSNFLAAFGQWPMWLNMFAIGVFFANLPYKAAKEQNPDARRRLRLLYYGSLVSLTPTFLTTLYAGFSAGSGGAFVRLPPWLFFPSVGLMALFPVTLAYVIVIERAMDVRVVIRQGLRYALARRAVVTTQIALTFAVLLYAVNVASGDDITRPNQITILALALLAIVLFSRFAERARLWLDRHFFREQVNTERILAELSDQVRGILDTETLKDTVTRRISEAMHVTEVRIIPGVANKNGYELALPLAVNERQSATLLLGAKRSEEPYTHSDIRLLESVATQTALALENSRLTAAIADEAAQRERMAREIEIAREVQQRLLPQRKPEVPGLDYFGICRPAASVGGDCYEYVSSQDGRLYLAVGDVAGKGVPAAMIMAGVNSAMRGLLAGGVTEVDELLTQLNRIIYESMPRNRFVTFALACYHSETRTLTYATAGHDPILCLRSDGEADWLVSRGLGLALSPTATYRQSITTLHPGDALLFYTDGVTEARNLEGDEFGVGPLTQIRPHRSAQELAESVLAEIDAFTANAPQHDDITLLSALVVK